MRSEEGNDERASRQLGASPCAFAPDEQSSADLHTQAEALEQRLGSDGEAREGTSIMLQTRIDLVVGWLTVSQKTGSRIYDPLGHLLDVLVGGVCFVNIRVPV